MNITPTWPFLATLQLYFLILHTNIEGSLLLKKHFMIKNMWTIMTKVHLMTTYNQIRTNLFLAVKLQKI
jgi:hypothetical protein